MYCSGLIYILFQAEISKIEKLSFLAQWYDPEASIVREFLLYYFPSDCTVEMVSKRISLKVMDFKNPKWINIKNKSSQQLGC